MVTPSRLVIVVESVESDVCRKIKAKKTTVVRNGTLHLVLRVNGVMGGALVDVLGDFGRVPVPLAGPSECPVTVPIVSSSPGRPLSHHNGTGNAATQGSNLSHHKTERWAFVVRPRFSSHFDSHCPA